MISISLPNLIDLGQYSFSKTGIKRIEDLGKITIISGETFRQCPNLEFVRLPQTLKTLGFAVFYACPKISTIISLAGVPPIASNPFLDKVPKRIYVPDESVEAYKTAPNWSTYADKIKPLSTYVETN